MTKCPEHGWEVAPGTCCPLCNFCMPEEKSQSEIEKEQKIDRDVKEVNYGPKPQQGLYPANWPSDVKWEQPAQSSATQGPTENSATQGPMEIAPPPQYVPPEQQPQSPEEPREDVSCEDALDALDQSGDMMVDAYCKQSKDENNCKIQGRQILQAYAEGRITEEVMQKKMKELIE